MASKSNLLQSTLIWCEKNCCIHFTKYYKSHPISITSSQMTCFQRATKNICTIYLSLNFLLINYPKANYHANTNENAPAHHHPGTLESYNLEVHVLIYQLSNIPYELSNTNAKFKLQSFFMAINFKLAFGSTNSCLMYIIIGALQYQYEYHIAVYLRVVNHKLTFVSINSHVYHLSFII